MKDLIKQQNQEVRKETGMIKEDTINEINFDKIKLPSQVNRFLERFVNSMKDANLNRMKRASILYKVIDAAGMTPQQLMADIQKIKQAMRK
jgi:phospholipase/lecithinase/hemolysin